MHNTKKCYSDPGSSTCVWCLYGIYDSIDYIEEIMTDYDRNKAIRLGIKMRDRYFMPECQQCINNRKEYDLENVLNIIYENSDYRNNAVKHFSDFRDWNKKFVTKDEDKNEDLIDAKYNIAQNVRLVKNNNVYSESYKPVPSSNNLSLSPQSIITHTDYDRAHSYDVTRNNSSVLYNLKGQNKRKHPVPRNSSSEDESEEYEKLLDFNHQTDEQRLKKASGLYEKDIPLFMDESYAKMKSPLITQSEEINDEYKNNIFNTHTSRSRVSTKSENYDEHVSLKNTDSFKSQLDAISKSTLTNNNNSSKKEKNVINRYSQLSPAHRKNSARHKSNSCLSIHSDSEVHKPTKRKRNFDRDNFFIDITDNKDLDKNTNIDDDVIDITKRNDNQFHKLSHILPDQQPSHQYSSINMRKQVDTFTNKLNSMNLNMKNQKLDENKNLNEEKVEITNERQTFESSVHDSFYSRNNSLNTDEIIEIVEKAEFNPNKFCMKQEKTNTVDKSLNLSNLTKTDDTNKNNTDYVSLQKEQPVSNLKSNIQIKKDDSHNEEIIDPKKDLKQNVNLNQSETSKLNETKESTNSVCSESLITLLECETSDNFYDSKMEKISQVGGSKCEKSVPFGEPLIQFSLSVIGECKMNIDKDADKEINKTPEKQNVNAESIISINRMQNHIRKHKPTSKINRFSLNSPLTHNHPSVSTDMNSPDILSDKDSESINTIHLTKEQTTHHKFEKEVKSMLKLAEKRAFENPFRYSSTNSSSHIKRFIIPGRVPVSQLNNVVSINDLKISIIRDKIHKRGNNGKYQHNWVQLKDTFLTCYNGSESILNDQFREENGDLICPNDDNKFLTRKYMIDLRDYDIHIGSNVTAKNGLFKCLGFKKPSSKTIDITDKNIKNISRYGNEYMVILKDRDVESIYYIPHLEFGLVKDSEVYSYRVDNIEIFLKWILTIKLRKGLVSWPIP